MAVNTNKGHRKGAVNRRSKVLNLINPTVIYRMNPSVKKSTAKRAELAVKKTLGMKK